MYTHFGLGFWDGRLHAGFSDLMARLARRNGWFVPVSQLLDYLAAQRAGDSVLQPGQRQELERLSGDKQDVAFGNQIRTYTLNPYQLVKDERTRYETGNVQAVLDGDVDAFIESYLQWRRQQAE